MGAVTLRLQGWFDVEAIRSGVVESCFKRIVTLDRFCSRLIIPKLNQLRFHHASSHRGASEVLRRKSKQTHGHYRKLTETIETSWSIRVLHKAFKGGHHPLLWELKQSEAFSHSLAKSWGQWPSRNPSMESMVESETISWRTSLSERSK